jgi:hypothetical protein
MSMCFSLKLGMNEAGEIRLSETMESADIQIFASSAVRGNCRQ